MYKVWKSISLPLRYLLLIVLSTISLYPILVLITTSFKGQLEAFAIPPVWFFKPTLANYKNVIQENRFLTYLSNSIIVALSSTALTMFVSALAAYSLSRMRYTGRHVISVSILLFQMIAPAVLVVPLFFLWTRVGLTGSRLGLILAYTGLNIPFAVWMLKAFIAEIPTEIDEAAIIDGCTGAGVFFRIILRLILPGIAATSVFTFRIAWNEFLMALVLTSRDTRTLPVAISLYLTEHGIDWGRLTAMGTIVAIPAIIFTFFAASQLIRGLTAGAVK